jgi:hypothetical protein
MQYLVLGRDNSNVDTIPFSQEERIQTWIQYLVLGRDNSNIDAIPCIRKGQFKRRYNTLF